MTGLQVFCKKVIRSISVSFIKELYTKTSQPGIMHGLSKIYKWLINNFPKLQPILILCMVCLKSINDSLTKLRPILSATNTAVIGPHFVPSFKHFPMSEHTHKHSFKFANDIFNQSANCFMTSLDVESLFTNVTFEETIKICVDALFKSEMTVSGVTKWKCLKCSHWL